MNFSKIHGKNDFVTVCCLQKPRNSTFSRPAARNPLVVSRGHGARRRSTGTGFMVSLPPPPPHTTIILSWRLGYTHYTNIQPVNDASIDAQIGRQSFSDGRMVDGYIDRQLDKQIFGFRQNGIYIIVNSSKQVNRKRILYINLI